MLQRFLSHIASSSFIEQGSKTLVATSGGVDSMVLCHLFHAAGLRFAVAHCNFQLRGEDSDQDELFVKNWCQANDVTFYSVKFDTLDFAQKNKLSIQVAARDLRYQWLKTTLQTADCQQIATAHHLDDSIETLFYNFTKGCGIRGLHGIPARNGSIIRPMLFATKKEILSYAAANNIAFREDASNQTDKYNRNLIRHQVVPVFEKINPSFQRTAAENIKRLAAAEQLYDFAVQQIQQQVVAKTEGKLKIDLEKLLTYPAPASVLYETLKPYGFNKDQIEQILTADNQQTGNLFQTPSARLLVDRSFLVVSFEQVERETLMLEALPDFAVHLPNGDSLTFQVKDSVPLDFGQSADSAWLDADKLRLPITIRHWQPGDWFCPIGMEGKRQKLQDYFSNQKLSRFEKERVWVLESGGEIAWIVGYRMDERFKITHETKSYIQAVFLQGNQSDSKLLT
ncbi:MAG: tRNA lysidine(34) synthetase TilS [Saprospiraceae bacterium]|nr:tRNA lysidine(34) synthetase TilS [Saprospiraceae bacterium]